jgi:4-alpha-glucanotransferase
VARISFALLLHSHQPVGNFDHVIEETYRKAYRPFLDLLAAHPKIRVGLHYTGFLLQWIEKHHPDFFTTLRPLVESGQVELVTGGFYEPILPVISDCDKRAQILKLTEFIRSRFGVTPRGAWLAERVWEPSLARPLADAGVEYIMLDDTHFIAAGVEDSGLRGYYYTEDAGLPLQLVPSLKSLRYTIPFREPAETIETLRRGLASEKPARPLFAMGDDLEKFGGWPQTFEHCYQNFWLERFCHAVEAASDWVEMTTLADYLESNPPLGRIYLPAASYEEMMIWALPLEAAGALRACLAESGRLPEAERFHRFLRGGLWRNFLSKYPESNQVHKLMLEVSRRLDSAGASTTERAALLAEARDHLLASQCNDAYWHGVFGGLYTPHLRSGIMTRLIRAERTLDRIEGGDGPTVSRSDFDCDGSQEIQIRHPLYGMVLRPADGGTVSSLRFKPAALELINSVARRPEEYHQEVRAAANAQTTRGAVPESIHDAVRAREPDLAALLRYDRYPRHAFRSYVFPSSKQWRDFELLALGESGEIAGGGWTAERESLDAYGTVRCVLAMPARTKVDGYSLRAAKWIAAGAYEQTWRIECRSRFDIDAGALGDAASPLPAFGLELVLNLLAPDAPGRYFLASAQGSRPEPLKFRGELAGRALALVDEWQGVKISIAAEPEPRWWIAPIETVSQSEGGFERVYQGSAILAVWSSWQSPPEGSSIVAESRLVVDVEPWRAASSA